MPSKQKICSIVKFLSEHDKELYQTIGDLYLFKLFQVQGRGITFLYPTDKMFRCKLVNIAYSNDPSKAIDMIKSLVLLDYLPTTHEFSEKKDDIPNALKNKLDIDTIDDKCITLKSCHKITSNVKYLSMKFDDNAVVWNLSGADALPTTGFQSSMKYSNKAAPKGYALRTKKINVIENEYLKYRAYDIYKHYLTNLYKRVLTDTFSQYADKVYNGMCAHPRASFYTLF